jgi:ATP-dependent Lon protease
MGFNNVVHLSNEVIEYIIEFYTLEPGVRKLKEIIFDLFGEINIDLLNASNENDYEFPINITIDDFIAPCIIDINKNKINSTCLWLCCI